MEFFAGTDMSAATVVASVILANVAGSIGAYVSMRERIRALEVKVDNQKEDLDAAHGKIRDLEKQEKGE